MYQVDPFGNNNPEQLTMGNPGGGWFESFAFDVRDPVSIHTWLLFLQLPSFIYLMNTFINS